MSEGLRARFQTLLGATRQAIGARLYQAALWVLPKTWPQHDAGRLVRFDLTAIKVLGRPVFHAYSVRGHFYLGKLEYRNQWAEPVFHPASDAMFSKQMVAELYAKMKDFH